MGRFDASAYGEQLGAAAYESLYPPDQLSTDEAVTFLSELARAGQSKSLLEMGIGSGRLAIRLSEQGLRVAGIDASAAMVADLRLSNPDISVKVGDFADLYLGETFSVVALVFNTIFDPRGVEVQLATFRNAARHLEPGGAFVVEAFVLSDEQRNGDWVLSPRFVGTEHVELQVARYDIESNSVEKTLIHLRPSGPTFLTVYDAYASPGELDVMAHVAGLERGARFSDWGHEPFHAGSSRHVTVYRRPVERDAANL
jgi:SAM-dependent methyltransferase